MKADIDRVLAHKEAGRFLLDRAHMYVTSSGIHAALCELGAALILGEAIERADRGELDDNDLLDWQKQIERGRGSDEPSRRSLPVQSI